MASTNIVNTSIRFNLENERHLRVYNFLNKINSDVYRSKNEFMIQALDTYFQGAGEIFQEENRMKENDELLEKVYEKTQEAVLKTLGSFYANNVIPQKEIQEPVSVQKVKEQVGITNPEVIGLIDKWND